MGSNPINLVFRFILELVALLTLGNWGWNQSTSNFRWFLAVLIPIIAALIWGTFAVPDDPSRSGKAPVKVPGILRLLLELGFFGVASWALFDLDKNLFASTFVIAVTIHYLLSYDRVWWLIKS